MSSEYAKQQFRETIDTSRFKCSCGKEDAHTPMVTCRCGNHMPLRFAYKCYYCGEYLCDACAAVHFGKTREQYFTEKAGQQ